MEAELLRDEERYLRLIAEEIEAERRKASDKRQKQFELNCLIIAENEEGERRRAQVQCDSYRFTLCVCDVCLCDGCLSIKYLYPCPPLMRGD